MKVKHYFLLLAFMYLLGIGYAKEASSDTCSNTFSDETLKGFFLDSDNIKKYKGKDGYVFFVNEYFPEYNMSSIAQKVSHVLSEKIMKDLKWQAFHGAVTQFKKLPKKILNKEGTSVQTKFTGKQGYVFFADTHYNGDMNITYKNVSAAIDKKLFNQLKWQAFQGTTSQFKKLPAKILNKNGTQIQKKFINMKGYIKFADTHYNGDMNKAYINVSATINKKLFLLLKWKHFQGTTSQFKKSPEKILNKDSTSVQTKFTGKQGYILFANTHYNGDMNLTHKNISAAIDKKLFNPLNWQAFKGTTSQFKKLPAKILGKDGTSVQTKFMGMKGYALFANTEYNGDMKKTYINVSAALDKKLFLLLEWKQFQGLASELKGLRTNILNKDGTQIQQQFLGKQGYILFADTHYNGDMQKTYKNISAIIDKKLFNQLNWQAFQGTTLQVKELRTNILNKDGTQIQQQFLGKQGYILFTDTYYNGDMQKTYINVSATLDKKFFNQLKWQSFQGTTSQLKEVFANILMKNGIQIRKQFPGMQGYATFADTYYNGNMLKTYINVSAALDKELFQKLEWKSFNGNTEQFNDFIDDFKINYPQNYYGLEGQTRVANSIFSGNTKKTYNMLSIMKEFFGIDKDAFHQLRWIKQ